MMEIIIHYLPELVRQLQRQSEILERLEKSIKEDHDEK